MSSSEFFLARQPILDINQKLVAYELLFRRGFDNQANVTDGLIASLSVIKHAFMDIGIDTLLGGKTAFININEELLMSDIIGILPPERVILEILETVPITQAVIDRCRDLKASRYRFALDDVIALNNPLNNIMPLIDIVKVDILQTSANDRASIIREVRSYNVQLLAEKVDTGERCAACRAEGFTLFQGYYFARPRIIQGNSMPPAVRASFKILELIAADVADEVLEDALKRAPDIALRLLRLANSAAFATPRKASGLRDAIRLLGRTQISRLVQIIALTVENKGAISTNALVQTAIIRGKMLEGLVEYSGQVKLKSRAFLLGMLSIANILFGETPEEFAASLSLDSTMSSALLEHKGPLGRMLELVELSESEETKAESAEIQSLLSDAACPSLEALNHLQLDALSWANTKFF